MISIQNNSILPSYNREKSRQIAHSMRYTNSLPASRNSATPGIPIHLRKSIDRLGSDAMNPMRKSMCNNSFQKPQIIEYYEDITPQAQFSESNSDQNDDQILVQETEYVNADLYRKDMEI